MIEYILISALGFVVCFAIGFVMARRYAKKYNPRNYFKIKKDGK